MTAGAGFDVDPPRLRAVAPQFDAVADRLDSARTALQGALAAEGACWGGDAAGQTFAQRYLPQAGAAMTALDMLAEVLRAIRTSLDASADAWEGADHSGAGRFGGASAAGGTR